ncbi:MAG: GNAT family N-acetyltransferase [Firmicutes bacterium]|nr:GNAT family N-acetyltransferase [Bacillota bacterium]
MISYRKADIKDADKLIGLRGALLMEIGNLSEFERREIEAANRRYFNLALKDNSFISWIALNDDKIVATSGLCFSVVPPFLGCLDGKTAYIMNMYTVKEYRNQGIGAELLKRIVEEAKNLGYKKITLNATTVGRKLYEKFGFKEVNNSMVFYIK